MRVVLVADRFPKPSETFIVHRFRLLLERGFDMHVVCNESRDQDLAFFPELASIPDVRRRIHQRWPLTRIGLALFPCAIIRCLIFAPGRTLRYVVRGIGELGPRVFWRLYRDAELVLLAPDIIHPVFGTFARSLEEITRWLGGKLIVSFQGADLNFAGLEDPTFYASIWDQADGFHFLGEDLLRRAERRGYTRDDRAVVITPGVDTSAFAPQPRHRNAGESLRILSVGRLHWKKGYEYAVRAIRLIVDAGIDVRYRVIGDGELRDALVYARSDEGLDDVIEILGAQPPVRVREEMQWADLLLHAATSEGFCYAAVEAQAMELPVVTSDADGLPENVANGVTGFIVPRRDPDALAAAIMRLAKDAELRATMGAAGRSRVLAGFSVAREIDGFQQLYRKIAARD